MFEPEQVQLLFDSIAADEDKLHDTIRHYWDIALKIAGFYILAIGSSLSFYAAHLKENMSKLWMIPVSCCCLSAILLIFIWFNFLFTSAIDKHLNTVNNQKKSVTLFWFKVYPLWFFVSAIALLALLVFIGCISIFVSDSIVIPVILFLVVIAFSYPLMKNNPVIKLTGKFIDFITN